MADPEQPEAAPPDDGPAVAAARPDGGDLAHAVVRARAAAALFGRAETVTIGRYQVIARLGHGGGGEVWSAHDPELGRRVALKRIDTSASDTVRARVKAEGQALARLTHPNVVPVHDVLDHGDHVVLVMELVDGQTLRAWVEERPAREIVRAYRGLAEGLAAMHAAGLVHRDVKPDNAMVGADGRVRVVDLGLALAAGDARADVAVGTPRYMAPEQAAGDEVTPAVDQYALCASLREALTAGGGAVPPWLVPVLERGTAREPAARFPSMTQLAAALAADPARRRRRLAAAGIALAAVGVAFGVGRSMGAGGPAPPRGCDGPSALDGVWDDARRQALGARLAAGDAPYSAAAAPLLAARLDDYAARWRELSARTCRASESRTLSPALADRRQICLGAAQAAFTALVSLAATGAPAELPELTQAAAGLPALARCVDDQALLSDVAPPPAAIAAPAAALTERLGEVQVHVDAARDDAGALAARALDDARALGYPPLLARALILDGQTRRDDPDHGAARFAEAVDAALAARDDATAVEAFARRLWASTITAGAAGQPDGVSVMAQLGDRLPGDGFARALLANNLGVAALARGDRAAARAAFTDALARAERVTGPGAVELLVVHGNLALVTDDDAERGRLLDELLTRRAELLGPAHPRTLDVRITRGMLAREPATAAAALAGACGDLAANHPTHGDDLADCWYELALVSEVTGDAAAARDALGRALDTEAAGAEPDRIALCRADAARFDGRLAEAEAGFTALLDGLGTSRIADERWWIGVKAAEARLGRARTRRAAGRRTEAAADATEAAVALEAIDARQRLPWIARRAELARDLAAELTSRSGSPR